jgi:hypothetical protein
MGREEKRPVSTTYTVWSFALHNFAKSTAWANARWLASDPSNATRMLVNTGITQNKHAFFIGFIN